MAPTWSSLALALAAVAVASAQSSSSSSSVSSSSSSSSESFPQFGVLAYPAGESRPSKTCFANVNGDPFTCGWYCAHAFYAETSADGRVSLTPFGEANNADNAYCSDCSLFEGEGQGLIQDGGVAEGTLAGGYKWDAYYDAATEEVIVNYTDYDEPCNIRYIVMEGKVMGVSHASDRPATGNTDATLKKTGWGGPRVVCEEALAECVNWHVYVEGDVADWQSLDEEHTDMVCPSRITPYGLSVDRYMGHDGTPRGVDSFTSGGQVVSDRNTIISFSPLNLTRCELYFDVVDGCWQGVGPQCSGAKGAAFRDSLPTVEDRLAAVKATRAAKKAKRAKMSHHGKQQRLRAAGRLPMAKPAHVPAEEWAMAMRHEGDFVAEEPTSWLPENPAAWAGWAVAAAVAAAWVGRRKCCQGHHGYKAVPNTESSPLLV